MLKNVRKFLCRVRAEEPGAGRTPIGLFYEFDSLISVRCLSRHGLDVRIAELRYGVKKLSALPHNVVYIDASAADALSVKTVARLLNRVDIRSIRGFFLNSTHFDWTSTEVAYGKKVSALYALGLVKRANEQLGPHEKSRPY